MLAPWLLMVLALPTGSANELRAAAAVTPRPASCQPAKGVWARAKAHAQRQHCAVLAKALLGLQRDPKAALNALAGLANTELATEALVAGARAKLALGDAQAAWVDFTSARERSPNALSDPLARHDAANAAARVAQPEHAAALYRQLISARELLPTERRSRLLLEAALSVLRLGPDNAEEAAEYLRLGFDPNAVPEARRERELFAFVAARIARPSSNVELQCSLPSSPADAVQPNERLPEFEEQALRALACERTDRQASQKHWQQYLAAAAAAPWRAWVDRRNSSSATGSASDQER